MPVRFTVNPKKDPRDQNSQPKYYAMAKSGGRADMRVLFSPGKRFKQVLDTAEFVKMSEN
jgi:hypothetical protein